MATRLHNKGLDGMASATVPYAVVVDDDVTLLFSDVEMPGDTDGFALAHYVAEHWPWIEIVIASGNVKPGPGDMPDKATFIGKPFNDRMVHRHSGRSCRTTSNPSSSSRRFSCFLQNL